MSINQSFSSGDTQPNSLVNPECTWALQARGVAMISVPLGRRGLVRKGNSLVVTVNPVDLVCSGSPDMDDGI